MWTNDVSVQAQHCIISKQYFPHIHQRFGVIWGGGSQGGQNPPPLFFLPKNKFEYRVGEKQKQQGRGWMKVFVGRFHPFIGHDGP